MSESIEGAIVEGAVAEIILPPSAEGYDVSTPLYLVEKQHVLKVLKHHGNNKTQAAHALGITIKTLYNKLHLWGELF